tara:strand:+ start:486 stop:695 length:210 start_codon:yes stop_codon:yes gene_type:complete
MDIFDRDRQGAGLMRGTRGTPVYERKWFSAALAIFCLLLFGLEFNNTLRRMTENDCASGVAAACDAIDW